MIYLTGEQVLFIHARVIAETSGSHGVRDLALLQSALARPQASFDDKDLYPDLLSKAAALLDFLINNHPFMDGNKRTGIAATGLFLVLNGRHLKTANSELEMFVLEVATSHPNISALTSWLKKHTESLPKT
jgi:death-on-curing protein